MGLKLQSADTGEGGRRVVVTSCLKTSVPVGLACPARLHILSLKTHCNEKILQT